jgi:hypothetical protein
MNKLPFQHLTRPEDLFAQTNVLIIRQYKLKRRFRGKIWRLLVYYVRPSYINNTI